MKYLVLLMILFASYLPSEEHKRFVGSSDAGKSDPVLWMIINQLQTFQTKLTNLEHKVETKSSTQFDKLGKQFSGFKTKLLANSKKIADLKNDVKVIKNVMKDMCNAGWKRFNNHCYMFRYGKVTWHQAKHECEKNKAYLVKIESSSENRWIGSEINVNARTASEQVWAGLNDLSREGHFTWAHDHSSLIYSNWNGGEPNNGNGGPYEHCGSIYMNGLSKWNDAPCSYKTGYICEK
ncbi:C-type lectin 9 [Mytilus edulis]|uniref:C-type lectin 9 n=1 Tax=Mytilus edulis TaxID=6550 RepID=A0A8S3SGV5_MYTED|nr:C-type lectin 9 [Mytilus edulis]